MSFITTPDTKAKVYAPGWFLKNNEACTRETHEFAQDSALVKTADNGGKHIPMGTIYPANDGTAIGITYEDVDVSSGNMPGSVVTKGEVYVNRLPAAPEAAAKTALEALGFVFTATSPAVTRPY